MWTNQKIEVIEQQAIERVVAAELELIAARAVLSEVETLRVRNYLYEVCDVIVGWGVCSFALHYDDPVDVVIEKIHPLGFYEHVRIEFRRFTKKGKPFKQTDIIAFGYLRCFKKKDPGNKPNVIPHPNHRLCPKVFE